MKTYIEILATGVESLYWHDLTADEQSEYDWMDADERDSATFIRHGRMTFATSEIMRSDSPDYDGVYGISNTGAYTFTYDHGGDTWTIGYIG